jgi:hypothetical protein
MTFFKLEKALRIADVSNFGFNACGVAILVVQLGCLFPRG